MPSSGVDPCDLVDRAFELLNAPGSFASAGARRGGRRRRRRQRRARRRLRRSRRQPRRAYAAAPPLRCCWRARRTWPARARWWHPPGRWWRELPRAGGDCRGGARAADGARRRGGPRFFPAARRRSAFRRRTRFVVCHSDVRVLTREARGARGARCGGGTANRERRRR